MMHRSYTNAREPGGSLGATTTVFARHCGQVGHQALLRLEPTYIFLGGVRAELPREHVQDLLADPAALGKRGEGEVVRVDFPQPWNNSKLVRVKAADEHTAKNGSAKSWQAFPRVDPPTRLRRTHRKTGQCRTNGFAQPVQTVSVLKTSLPTLSADTDHKAKALAKERAAPPRAPAACTCYTCGRNGGAAWRCTTRLAGRWGVPKWRGAAPPDCEIQEGR